MHLRQNQKGLAPLPVIVTAAALILFFTIAAIGPFQDLHLSSLFQKGTSEASTSYLETFDGNPVNPLPFTSSEKWDLAIHSRDTVNLLQLTPMSAHHGADCSAPIDSSGKLLTHYLDGSYPQSVFLCKDHMMTAIRAGVHGAEDEGTVEPAETDGYGVIYLTPNQLVDFSQGTAVIKFDITTWAASGRDWWDLWITPFNENLQLPLYDWLPDLQGPPKNALHFQESDMNGSGPGLAYDSFAHFVDRGDSDGDNWWTSYESFMKVSPQKRTTFEFHISKTHIKAGIPAGQVDVDGNPINNGQAFWWIDKDIPPLSWDRGIIQLGHHSYNPSKDCGVANDPAPDGTCKANTWHWDNVSISHAIPFTIIPATQRYITGETTGEVRFLKPAPANAYVRWTQKLGNTEISFDNGQTWQTAQKQVQKTDCTNGHFCNMWHPIPEGTQKVLFRTHYNSAYWWSDQGFAKDFAIWSLTAPVLASATPQSTTPSPSATPAPTTSSKLGDANGDNKVDIFDYSQVLSDFGKKNDPSALGDVDGDDDVDIFDYSLVLSTFRS